MDDGRVAVLEHCEGFGFDDGRRDVIACEGADRVERVPKRVRGQFDEPVVIAGQQERTREAVEFLQLREQRLPKVRAVRVGA